MKKQRRGIYERIKQIPDCCFQVHWKTYNKGFLSFKQFPKDIIVVYKQDGSLRIDFHVDDFEKPTPNGNFTILLRSYES